MSSKQAPEYIRKIVKFGEKELELFSIDGLTWSSRPEELHLIQERRENSRVSFGDKRIAPRPGGANRLIPKKGVKSSGGDNSYLGDEEEVENEAGLIIGDQEEESLIIPKIRGSGRSILDKEDSFETEDLDEVDTDDSNASDEGDDGEVSEEVVSGKGKRHIKAPKSGVSSKTLKTQKKIKLDTKLSNPASSVREKRKGAAQNKIRGNSNQMVVSQPRDNVEKNDAGKSKTEVKEISSKKSDKKAKSVISSSKVSASVIEKKVDKNNSNLVKSEPKKGSNKASKQTKVVISPLKKNISSKKAVATKKITEKKTNQTKKKKQIKRK
jgi:hypothetical protein